MTERSIMGMWLALACLSGACAEGEPAEASSSDAGAQADAAQPAPRRLATSATHSCAIRHAGLFRWGSNGRGELGDGTTTDSEVAVHAQAAGDDVVEVAVQSGRTCVRRSTGEVACWGANQLGQIGDSTREAALTAVPALGIADAHELAVDCAPTRASPASMPRPRTTPRC